MCDSGTLTATFSTATSLIGDGELYTITVLGSLFETLDDSLQAVFDYLVAD